MFISINKYKTTSSDTTCLRLLTNTKPRHRIKQVYRSVEKEHGDIILLQYIYDGT